MNAKGVLKYAPCALVGAYSADMLFRAVRYGCALLGKSPIADTILTALDDADSFMIFSAVLAVLISAVFFRFNIRRRTGALFASNAALSTFFLTAVNSESMPWNVFLYSAPIVLLLYAATGILCVYSGIKDLYINLGEKQ